MPFIKGITDTVAGPSTKPANNTQIPPINPVDVERFKASFSGASPVHGILDRALVMYQEFALLPCSYLL